jgi:protein CpxP
MKKYILSIILFVAVATSTFAQNGQQKNPEGRAKWLTESIAKYVTLTPEQRSKIYALGLERANAVDAVTAAAGEGNKPNAEKMKTIGKKFDEGVQGVLTDEQNAAMKAKKEAEKAKKSARGK